MRPDTPPDPAVEAELQALDAALEGRGGDPGLARVVAEVRAARPAMPPGLELRLQAAVAEGFPRRRRRTAGRRAWLAPALGGLAAAAVAVAVVLPGGEDEAGVAPAGPRSETAKQLPFPQSGGAAQGAPAPPAPQAASSAPRAARVAPGPRRVRRAAELTLTTPLGELQDTGDAVARTADRLGGRVQRSDVSASDGGGEATFDLRIPAGRLDAALAALSELGDVTSRTQRTADVTARFTAVRERLADARAERAALLRALAAATTAPEIESLRERLDIARSRIAAAAGDLESARRTVALARVGVTVLGVTGEKAGGAGSGGGAWTPARALGDALDVLAVAAGVLIVGAAAGLPVALLVALALLARRAYRRRARRGALERAAAV